MKIQNDCAGSEWNETKFIPVSNPLQKESDSFDSRTSITFSIFAP
jgi:hypothetical protein